MNELVRQLGTPIGEVSGPRMDSEYGRFRTPVWYYDWSNTPVSRPRKLPAMVDGGMTMAGRRGVDD